MLHSEDSAASWRDGTSAHKKLRMECDVFSLPSFRVAEKTYCVNVDFVKT